MAAAYSTAQGHLQLAREEQSCNTKFVKAAEVTS
jgi:hypothetical protein